MMIRLPGKNNRFRAGAHLVEFALVLPVFFLFVFGLIEFGRGLMVSSLIANSARSGCRAGILPGKQNSDVNTAVDGQLQAQGISGYTTTIQVNGNAAVDVSAAQTADIITVQVSVPVATASWLPNLSFLSGSITGQYSMPHE